VISTVAGMGKQGPELAMLDEMLAEMERAPELYRPTNFWQTGLSGIVTDLRSRGIEDFRSHPSARMMYVPTYTANSRLLRLAGGVLGRAGLVGLRSRVLNLQQATFDHAVATGLDPDSGLKLRGATESTVGRPAEQFTFDGQRYSRSFLNYLRGLVFFKRSVPDADVRRVLEIGGGYGTLGEILLQGNDDVTYVDVDIPPVGFVAGWYLQQVFGRSRVAAWDETRKWNPIDLTTLDRSAVLCPWQLPDVTGQVDLFVNFISFQEMEHDVVENYFRHVDRLGARWVLLRNSVTGKPVGGPGELGVRKQVKRDDYLDIFSSYELVASDYRLFGHFQEGDLTSEVMVLARR
jgi:putative sugar O-methyltransferase